MRKIYFLMLSMLCSLAVTANAQTLLDEDFEHTQSDVATTQMPDGWTAVTSLHRLAQGLQMDHFEKQYCQQYDEWLLLRLLRCAYLR